MAEPGTENPFQRWRNCNEGVAAAVRGTVCVFGKVDIATVDDPQLAEEIITDAQPREPIRVATRVVGEDPRIFGVGFGLAGVEIRGATHLQTRDIRDGVPAGTRDGQEQLRSRGWLIDHQHDSAMHAGVVDETVERCLVVRDCACEVFGAIDADHLRVVLGLAHVDTDEHVDGRHVDTVGHLHSSLARCQVVCSSGAAAVNHLTNQLQRTCSRQRSATPNEAGGNTPQAINVTGDQSPARLAEHTGRSCLTNYPRPR